MHTIRPLDEEAVIAAAASCRCLITAEEHSIHGGLGEACAALLLEKGICLPFARAGIPDEDTVTGSQAEIFSHYGLSAEGLFAKALQLLKTGK